jgi:sortase A
LLNTSELGAPGNAAIAGHRDTHFETLKTAALGDLVYLTSRQQDHIVKQVYRVTDIRIVDQYDLDVLAPTPQSSITLITCYPFDSIEPNPTQRYIVHAQKI